MNVNLIEYRQAWVARARVRLLALALAGCAGVVLLGSWVGDQLDRAVLRQLDERSAASQSRQRELEQQAVAHRGQLLDQALKSRHEEVLRHRREGLAVAQAMVGLLARVPDGVRLDRIEFKGPQITVSGRALSAAELARFIEAVERSGQATAGLELQEAQPTGEGTLRFQLAGGHSLLSVTR